jgi:hypothetical protein
MGDPTIQIGHARSGLMVVPSGAGLRRDLESRLMELGWPAGEWLHDLTRRGDARDRNGQAGFASEAATQAPQVDLPFRLA